LETQPRRPLDAAIDDSPDVPGRNRAAAFDYGLDRLMLDVAPWTSAFALWSQVIASRILETSPVCFRNEDAPSLLLYFSSLLFS
jgi:hypothetical protein